jgi:basic membrane protein A
MRMAALLLVLVLTQASLAAAKPTVGFVTGSPGLGDSSFNDLAFEGARAAQQDMGFELTVLKPMAGNGVDASEMRDLMDRAGVIVLLGEQHRDLALECAKAHPEKRFILVDAALSGTPNVASAVFDQHEGAFLAGALAAAVTETGKLGFVGGTAIAPVVAFEKGFREGARFMNPDVAVLVEYAAPAGDYSGFASPERGYQLALAHYENDADIVFAAAGRTGTGVIKAASDAGHLAIGVDADQDGLARGFVLTSVMKRLDTAVYDQIKKALVGGFTPGTVRYGLENGGVSLSDMKYTRDRIPGAVMKRIADVRAKIISGEITVANPTAGK